jgi:hypothetical protein
LPAVRRFTTSIYEREFIAALRQANEGYASAAAALRGLPSRTCIEEQVRAATAALFRVEQQLRRSLAELTSERVTWLRRLYKHYFPSYQVGKVFWDAPSGAHLSSVMELDLILGTAGEDRISDIRQRLRYLVHDDRSKIERALEASSEPRTAALRLVAKGFARASGVHWALLRRALIGSGYEPIAVAGESRNVMTYQQVKIYALRRGNATLQK